MPEGPFGNFEVRGPFADNNLWVGVHLDDKDSKRGGVSDYALQELEEKALELSIQDGDGQAFATPAIGPGKAKIFYRTYYTTKTGARAGDVFRESKRLASVRSGFKMTTATVLCETPSPTQDVLPSQIDPTFRHADDK